MLNESSNDALTRFLANVKIYSLTNSDFWENKARTFGPDFYAELFQRLTRLDFHPDEAKRRWLDVVRSSAQMAQTLGRPVDLRVALLEHLVDREPVLKDPVVVEKTLLKTNERLTLMDELTGLYNRRYFNTMLDKEMERSGRSHRPCSLLMLDIDHFKRVNDTLGHQAGDAVLAQLGRLLMVNARLADHVTRYGGEEFAIILPRAGRKATKKVARRYLKSVAAHPFTYKNKNLDQVTISIGAATFPSDAIDAAALVTKADKALYMAKGLGRNRLHEANQDKRTHPRFGLRIPVSHRVPGSSDPEHASTTVNVSMGGMLCEFPGHVEKGKRMDTVLREPSMGLCLPLSTYAVHVDQCGKNSQVGMAIDNESAWKDLYRAYLMEMTDGWR